MILKRTGSSKNLSETLKYIEPNSNKAHQNNNGIKKRNLLKIGLGCRIDKWQHTAQDFKYYSNQHKRKNKTYNFVLSTKKGDFDPKDPEDVYTFGQYAKKFAQHSFKGHQVLIALQADNTKGLLHAHMIVNNTNVNNGKALSSKNRDIYRLKHRNDEMVKQFNLAHPSHKIFDLKKHQNEPSQRQSRLINLIHMGVNQSKSVSDLRNYFKSNNIQMRVRRPRKSSKYSKRKYNHGRGVVFKFNNGKSNKSTYIKLSSLSLFYLRRFHHKINYGAIKHKLYLNRIHKPQKINDESLKNNLQNISQNMNKFFTNGDKSNIQNKKSLLGGNQQTLAPKKSPQVEKKPIHAKYHNATKQLTGWKRVNPQNVPLFHTNCIKFGNIAGFKPVNLSFHIPIFNDSHLNSLIHKYESESNEESSKIQDLNNFEAKSDDETKKAIESKVENEISYQETAQNLKDNAIEIKQLQHQVQIHRGFGLSF